MQVYRFSGIQDSETEFPDGFRKRWGDFPEGAKIYALKGDSSVLKTREELKAMGAIASLTVCNGTHTSYTLP